MCDQAPFHPGQKIVRIGKTVSLNGSTIVKGNIYTCVECFKCPTCERWTVALKEFPVNGDRELYCCNSGDLGKGIKYFGGWSKTFAPLNPYSNSVSKELAEQAMKTPIEIDQPIKQLEQAN